MARIKIDLNRVKAIPQTVSGIRLNQLATNRDRLVVCRKSLDARISATNNIGQRLDNVVNQILSLEQNMKAVEEILLYAYDEYDMAETTITKTVENIIDSDVVVTKTNNPQNKFFN